MTVEKIKGKTENYDDFPVGMRVLAVDDDLICLKLLEGLLRKCQYKVTTACGGIAALNMLRENKDRFDLVISDVHMPDMDGFKVLELVGLEMDLPVIMLSANSDPKLVMKGVIHGACDYLVKPVRIEELRNIWQHVIRRRKFDAKHQKLSSNQESQQGCIEVGQWPPLSGSTDQSGKLNKKRKDDKDEAEENEHENEDPATQKKPRVVWSIELHRKFVAAVNQLGIEKAVPKRILDLMDVEGLTRENVASHLQKYRLYLKRISSVASQQANRVAAFGSQDATYMRMGSVDGLRDFQTLVGSGRLPNMVLSPYASSAMLGRLNSPAGVNLHNLTSPALIQPTHGQNFSNSINTFRKLPLVISPANHKETLLQGLPSLELDQFHQNKCTAHLEEFNPANDSQSFTATGTFTDTRGNSLGSAPNGSVTLQENFTTLNGGGHGNQSSFNMASFRLDSFSTGVSSADDLLDPGKCNNKWQSASQLSKFESKSSPLAETLNNGRLPLGHVRENHSSAVNDVLNPHNFSATTTVSAHFANSRRGLHCEEDSVGDVGSNLSQVQNQKWGTHSQNFPHNSDNVFGSLNSQSPPNNRIQDLDQTSVMFNSDMAMSLIGRSSENGSVLLQPAETEKSAADLSAMPNEDYLLGQMKPQGAFAPQSHDYMNDLVNAVIKQEQDGGTLNGEFTFNPYTSRMRDLCNN